MKWTKNFNYPQLAMFNFIVLSVFGVLLRYLQLYDIPLINYQFILHAHSHFAFSGWMFFTIALLIGLLCNNGKINSRFKTVLVLAIISAYGMLASFSLEGYKLVSIGFSTLFVLVTFRFTYLVLKGDLLKERVNATAYKLIRGGLILLCLSALGPFALGPLAACGLKNTSYYQDAIYFYLHFQMNGFMLMAALGLLASTLRATPLPGNTARWLLLFIYSTLPLYFIFTLWGKPDTVLWVLAAIGSGLNLLSWLALCIHFRRSWSGFSFLEKAALIALTIKCVLQVSICIPAIGEWTFLNRNLIIGYIHLLTLGIIMPLLIGQFTRNGFFNVVKTLVVAGRTYVFLVVGYLGLLFTQPLLTVFNIAIPYYQDLLFLCSVLFLPIGWLLLRYLKKYRPAT